MSGPPSSLKMSGRGVVNHEAMLPLPWVLIDPAVQAIFEPADSFPKLGIFLTLLIDDAPRLDQQLVQIAHAGRASALRTFDGSRGRSVAEDWRRIMGLVIFHKSLLPAIRIEPNR